MKKQLLIVGITAILIAVGLSGCTEQTQDETKDETANGNLVTAMLNTLSLTLNDLPEGYTNTSELYDTNPQTPNSLESYQGGFSYDVDDEKCGISVGLVKFDTIENAGLAFKNYDREFHYTYYEDPSVSYMGVTPVKISESFGDESNMSVGDFSEFSSTYNFMSRTIIVFRISNVVVTIFKDDWSNVEDPDPSDTNLAFSIDLAKIIESRINDNII